MKILLQSAKYTHSSIQKQKSLLQIYLIAKLINKKL